MGNESNNTQAEPPIFFFEPVKDFLVFVCFPDLPLTMMMVTLMRRKEERKKGKAMLGASPWGAHVYQIACPVIAGEDFRRKERRVLERPLCGIVYG